MLAGASHLLFEVVTGVHVPFTCHLSTAGLLKDEECVKIQSSDQLKVERAAGTDGHFYSTRSPTSKEGINILGSAYVRIGTFVTSSLLFEAFSWT